MNFTARVRLSFCLAGAFFAVVVVLPAIYLGNYPRPQSYDTPWRLLWWVWSCWWGGAGIGLTLGNIVGWFVARRSR